MVRPSSRCDCKHDSTAHDANYGVGGSSAWWMLLSHHPPCDLNRTWRVFGVYVCVRCLGMAVACLVALAVSAAFPVKCCPWTIVSCVATMLPAGIDFMLGELLVAYPSSNALRFATGLVFGFGCGICIAWCFTAGQWIPIALFVSFALLMQFVIAFAFRACGHLEEYVAKYEEACYGNDSCKKNVPC